MTDNSAYLKDPWGDDDTPFPTFARIQHEGREFVREASGRWFDDWRYELKPGPDGEPVIVKPEREPYHTHSLSRWKDRPINEPRWFLEGWVPMGRSVGLYGKPGARKSTLLLQWMIGSALGGKSFVTPLAAGPTYGLFCEDDEDEIARRARAILSHYGADFDDARDCHPESLVTAGYTQFFGFRKSGMMIPTPVWEKFNEDLDHIQPVFVVLDVGANFFGGNEINRTESSAFLRLLDKVALERGFALAASFHPSLRGLRDKTLSSGSTAWEGGVRARLTITDPTDDDEDNELPNQSDRRILTLVKANYAKNGQTIELVIRDGCFVPADLDPQIQAERKRSPINDAADEAALLQRLKEALDAGTTLSNFESNPHYAPVKLCDDSLPAMRAKAAFKRLFDKKILRFDQKKRGADRWIVNESAQRETDE